MSRGFPLRALGAGALVLALAAGTWFWLRETSSDAPDAFRIVSPESRELNAAVLATGTLRLKTGSEVRIGSQVSGVVSELNVTVGSPVKRGGIIARLDSRSIDARLAVAKADVEVMDVELQRARAELRRVQTLVPSGLLSQREFDERRLDVTAAEARLRRAQRAVTLIETELGYTVIRSPIDGTIAAVSTQKGETVAASFAAPTFATVIADGALQLIALVDETDIGRITPGAAVRFTVEAFPAEEFAGRVRSIAPKGVIIAGVVNYEALIDISPVPPQLKPDMTANVQIQTASRRALMLPTEAVQRDGTQRFVLLERKGAPLRRNVTVGMREGRWIEIRQGISANETIRVPTAARESRS